VVLAIILLGMEDVISIGQLQDDPERASRGGWVFQDSDSITQCPDLRYFLNLNHSSCPDVCMTNAVEKQMVIEVDALLHYSSTRNK